MSFNELLKSLVFADAGIDAEIEFDDQGAGKIKAKTTVSAPRVFSGTADEFSQLPPEQQDKFNKMQEHIDNFNIRNRNIPGEEGEFERLQDETMPAFAQIKTELTPAADPANAVGAASGALTATLGTPGDVVGLASGAIYGIYKLAFPNEDETRLQSAASGFANVLGTVSETAGSMYTRSVFDGWLDKMPLDEETKTKIGEGADLGEWFGVPGAGTAVAASRKGIIKGAQKLGDFVANAPDRIAAREADTAVQLNAGVDVPAAVDKTIVGVQKAFQKPTKENPVTAVAPTETEPGIIAFHGSGADFDQFEIDKIGTGEGAQAYGYGLYFTDSEDIAKFYKDMMARNVDIDGRPYIRGNQINDNLVDEDIADDLAATNGDLEAAIKSSEEFLQEMIDADNVQAINSTRKELEKLKQLRGRVTVGSETGKTYKVSLEPKAEEFVDYDLPIGEQPEQIKVALIKALEDINDPELNANIMLEARAAKEKQEAVASLNKELDDFSNSLPNQESKETFAKLRELLINKKHKWSSMVNRDDMEEERRLFEEFTKLVPPSKYPDIDPNIIYDIQRSLKIASPKSIGSFLPTDKKTADALSNAGIKGIKYRAAGSRGAGIDDVAAERNYVIFDDKMIKILEKYGIVGPVAITGVAASQQGEAETSEAM